MIIYSSAIVKVPLDGMVIDPEAGHIGDFVLVVQKRFEMARGCQINSGSKIVGNCVFRMGEFSTVGYNVVILTGTDTVDGSAMNDYAPDECRSVVRGEVCLGKNVFIGSNTILSVTKKNPKIVIGDNSVVMAGSYIDKPVPANVIYGHFGPGIEITKKRG